MIEKLYENIENVKELEKDIKETEVGINAPLPKLLRNKSQEIKFLNQKLEHYNQAITILKQRLDEVKEDNDELKEEFKEFLDECPTAFDIADSIFKGVTEQVRACKGYNETIKEYESEFAKDLDEARKTASKATDIISGKVNIENLYFKEVNCIMVAKDFNEHLDYRNELQGSPNAVDFRNKYLADLDEQDAWKDDSTFIMFDFKGVKSFSPSFCSEAFTYFLRYATKERILSKIQLIGLNEVFEEILKSEFDYNEEVDE